MSHKPYGVNELREMFLRFFADVAWTQEQIDQDVADGITIKCDTLEDLAKELDIDPDTFKATVERYNELCENGEDVDFGKPSKYMKPIKQAPFWGLRKHIRVSSIDSGIMTNENAQALTADGKVKPCLHSADEYSLKGLDFAGMKAVLEEAIWNKPAWHGDLDALHRSRAGRNMNEIGG